MFKHGIIPRVSDSSRLELKFEEDDDGNFLAFVEKYQLL